MRPKVCGHVTILLISEHCDQALMFSEGVRGAVGVPLHLKRYLVGLTVS